VVSELAVNNNKSPIVREGRRSAWHQMEGDSTLVEIFGNAPRIRVRSLRRVDDEKDEAGS